VNAIKGAVEGQERKKEEEEEEQEETLTQEG